MELLLKENYAIINFNQERALILLHLVSDITFDNYKSVLNTLLEKIIEKNCSKLIVDQRYNEKIGMEEKAWLISQWFPNLQKNIGEDFKLSVIAANSLFAKVGAEYIVTTLKNKSNLAIQLHNNMNDALKWMED